MELGIAARTAAFSSPARGADITRLAEQEGVDLLVTDCQGAELDPETGGARARAVRRRPAGAGGRIRCARGRWSCLRRRRPRLGGACARSLGRARDGRSASADRRGPAARTGATRAACSPTRRSSCSASPESAPSRCWRPRAARDRRARRRRRTAGGRPVRALAPGGARAPARRAARAATGSHRLRPAGRAAGWARAGGDPHPFQVVADRATRG